MLTLDLTACMHGVSGWAKGVDTSIIGLARAANPVWNQWVLDRDSIVEVAKDKGGEGPWRSSVVLRSSCKAGVRRNWVGLFGVILHLDGSSSDSPPRETTVREVLGLENITPLQLTRATTRLTTEPSAPKAKEPLRVEEYKDRAAMEALVSARVAEKMAERMAGIEAAAAAAAAALKAQATASGASIPLPLAAAASPQVPGSAARAPNPSNELGQQNVRTFATQLHTYHWGNICRMSYLHALFNVCARIMHACVTCFTLLTVHYSQLWNSMHIQADRRQAATLAGPSRRRVVAAGQARPRVRTGCLCTCTGGLIDTLQSDTPYLLVHLDHAFICAMYTCRTNEH
jgi:hypothetical protein